MLHLVRSIQYFYRLMKGKRKIFIWSMLLTEMLVAMGSYEPKEDFHPVKAVPFLSFR